MHILAFLIKEQLISMIFKKEKNYYNNTRICIYEYSNFQYKYLSSSEKNVFERKCQADGKIKSERNGFSPVKMPNTG